MKRFSLLALVLTMGLVTMACGFNFHFNLPIKEIQVGPTQIDEIKVALPKDTSTITQVELDFGAGKLVVSPGAENDLIKGVAKYNLKQLKPEINITGEKVTIQTGEFTLNGIPNFQGRYKNTWELGIGDAPIDLSIMAGAYEGDFELGGLAINSLKFGDGAAQSKVKFSEPNKIEMKSFRYETGASTVSLTGLANADVETLNFSGGAGTYTFDFSGVLKRDMDVTIGSGMSSIEIIVPAGLNARVFFDGALANIDLSGKWQKDGNEYYLDGNGPLITINVNVGASSVSLKNK